MAPSARPELYHCFLRPRHHGSCSQCELRSRHYQGSIELHTNDPELSQVSVPVTMTVTGDGLLRLAADSVDFGTVRVGENKNTSYQLINDGAAPVILSHANSSSSHFKETEEWPRIVKPFSSVNLAVYCEPRRAAATGHPEHLQRCQR